MRDRAAGFTLVEVLIVLAIAAPILFAVLSATERVGRTVSTDAASATSGATIDRIAERASRMIRAAHRSTLRVRATQADVDAARAAAVGDWMPALELDPRPGIQFQSASGTLTINATDLTPPRELEWVRDEGELANDQDDDGDGLVDEGALFLTYDDYLRTSIATGLESVQFELDGRALRCSLLAARPDGSGGVHRTQAEYVWWIRNP